MIACFGTVQPCERIQNPLYIFIYVLFSDGNSLLLCIPSRISQENYYLSFAKVFYSTIVTHGALAHSLKKSCLRLFKSINWITPFHAFPGVFLPLSSQQNSDRSIDLLRLEAGPACRRQLPSCWGQRAFCILAIAFSVV